MLAGGDVEVWLPWRLDSWAHTRAHRNHLERWTKSAAGLCRPQRGWEDWLQKRSALPFQSLLLFLRGETHTWLIVRVAKERSLLVFDISICSVCSGSRKWLQTLCPSHSCGRARNAFQQNKTVPQSSPWAKRKRLVFLTICVTSSSCFSFSFCMFYSPFTRKRILMIWKSSHQKIDFPTSRCFFCIYCTTTYFTVMLSESSLWVVGGTIICQIRILWMFIT